MGHARWNLRWHPHDRMLAPPGCEIASITKSRTLQLDLPHSGNDGYRTVVRLRDHEGRRRNLVGERTVVYRGPRLVGIEDARDGQGRPDTGCDRASDGGTNPTSRGREGPDLGSAT